MLPLELLIQTKFLQKLILPSQLQESLQEALNLVLLHSLRVTSLLLLRSLVVGCSLLQFLAKEGKTLTGSIALIL